MLTVTISKPLLRAFRGPALLLLIFTSAFIMKAAQTGKQLATSKAEHAFRGTVDKIDPSTGQLTVTGENVPGWMPAMTMNYRIDNPGKLRIKPGDRITAKVYDGDFTTLHKVRVAAMTRLRPSPKFLALPPLSYVCASPGEESLLEEKPGRCPQSGLPRVPVRLITVYSCLKFESFIQEMPGICPVDKSELVPITAGLYFLCKSQPHDRRLEPGKCADGTSAIRQYERRPHGDHNPRHGGQFFMADDSWHHLEGTWVPPNTFRVYFYNDMTQPLAANAFSAAATRMDAKGNEITGPVPLNPSPSDRNVLEMRLPAASLPANFGLRVKFKPGDKEHIFDFTFAEYSREPAPQPSVSSTPAASLQQQSGASSATASLSSPSAAVANDSYTPATIRPEAPLPTTTPELLAELAKRAQSVKTALDRGDLTGLWYPAIGAKEVALALEENHLAGLSQDQRLKMESAVKRLTLAAWQIDAAGDLGNKQRVVPLYGDFAAAVAEIQALYASR